MAARISNRDYAVVLGRAFGGALIFSMPMLMTMEMWWLGFSADRLRLALFLLAVFPLLVGLSYFAGLRETERWTDAVQDALTAYAVGFLSSALFLWLFGVLAPEQTLAEMLGKVALQAVPASIGAVLSRTQLNLDGGPGDTRPGSAGPRTPRGDPYAIELFFMTVGALFVAFNVAPTEEMLLIAFQMSSLQALALALVSLLLMHAFVYTLDFAGQESPPEHASLAGIFFRFTVVGYAIALLVSLYVLWTFGRTDGLGPAEVMQTTVVLGFASAIGAATARLIL